MIIVPATEIESLLDKEGKYVREITEKAQKDSKLLELVLDGVTSKNESYRYNCSKVLSRISEQDPELLYPEWNRFEILLRSENAFHRAIAVYVIARLASVDMEEKFEKIFNKYFGMLDDKSLMISRYVAQNAGIIAKSKPKLMNRITLKLLKVEETHFDQGRRDLISGDALESFEEYFEKSKHKEKIIALARRLEKSRSPRAKMIAKKFLHQHEPIKQK